MGYMIQIARNKEPFIDYRWVCLPVHVVTGFSISSSRGQQNQVVRPAQLFKSRLKHPHRFPKYNMQYLWRTSMPFKNSLGSLYKWNLLVFCVSSLHDFAFTELNCGNMYWKVPFVSSMATTSLPKKHSCLVTLGGMLKRQFVLNFFFPG